MSQKIIISIFTILAFSFLLASLKPLAIILKNNYPTFSQSDFTKNPGSSKDLASSELEKHLEELEDQKITYHHSPKTFISFIIYPKQYARTLLTEQIFLSIPTPPPSTIS